MIKKFWYNRNEIFLYYYKSWLRGFIDNSLCDKIRNWYIPDLDGDSDSIEIFRERIVDYNIIGWIDELFVEVDKRNEGIGKELVKSFIEICRQEEVDLICCEPDIEKDLDYLINFYVS